MSNLNEAQEDLTALQCIVHAMTIQVDVGQVQKDAVAMAHRLHLKHHNREKTDKLIGAIEHVISDPGNS